MIPIRFGLRFAGMMTLPGRGYIGTRVFHIWYLPIIPLGTYRMTDEDTGVPTEFSLLSLVAAFFKAWGFIAAVGLTALAIDAGRNDPFIVYVAAAAILFALVYWSWLFLGRTPETRPETAGIALVGVIALVSFGALGYSIFDRMETQRTQSFLGAIPVADSQASATELGMGRVRAVPATSKSTLSVGQMVEITVPGGYAHGVITSAAPASEDWVKVKAGRGGEDFTVHRDAISVLDVE